jgi:hypothetical protein
MITEITQLICCRISMKAKILAIAAPPARTARHEALGGIKFTLSQRHFALRDHAVRSFHAVLNSSVDHRRNKTGNAHLPSRGFPGTTFLCGGR